MLIDSDALIISYKAGVDCWDEWPAVLQGTSHLIIVSLVVVMGSLGVALLCHWARFPPGGPFGGPCPAVKSLRSSLDPLPVRPWSLCPGSVGSGDLGGCY